VNKLSFRLSKSELLEHKNIGHCSLSGEIGQYVKQLSYYIAAVWHHLKTENFA
jgi:hypothetical protein